MCGIHQRSQEMPGTTTSLFANVKLPLNGIPVVQTWTDPINQLITKAKDLCRYTKLTKGIKSNLGLVILV